MMMRVPQHRVGMRQPAEELTQLVFDGGRMTKCQ